MLFQKDIKSQVNLGFSSLPGKVVTLWKIGNSIKNSKRDIISKLRLNYCFLFIKTSFISSSSLPGKVDILWKIDNAIKKINK